MKMRLLSALNLTTPIAAFNGVFHVQTFRSSTRMFSQVLSLKRVVEIIAAHGLDV